MKFLLAAINAKYIHSNLGIYSLSRYAKARVSDAQVEIGEYTINHQMEYILQDIYGRKPDAVGFSCYIWNISYVMELAADLKKVLPDVHIWLGGPEVSYCAGEILGKREEVTGVMVGEGEETFARLLEAYEAIEKETGRKAAQEEIWEKAADIPGVAWRRKKGGGTFEIVENPQSPPINMDDIPFPYENLDNLENRIIYYESSRGCPFSCSYCLSSIDKSVRFRSIELVKKELDFFLEKKVPQIKFVDRTFNCKKSHAMAIWKHMKDHDNGITNFHFEISADLLDEEELEFLASLRPGLAQLEIGVQTGNLLTIKEIRRKTDLQRLKEAVARIKKGRNIHRHLDLIAGLPFEDYESFAKSFCMVYDMEPEELQLGFLKVLKGSYMMDRAGAYGLKWKGSPPYEVLSTKWLSYGDVIKLKGVEEMVEVYYNSRQFVHTLKNLAEEFESPFVMFECLSRYYEREGLYGLKHSRIARYEILYDFIKETAADLKKYRDLLMYDLYLRENVKSRPYFASDQSIYKDEIKPLYDEYFRSHRRKDKRMVHIEAMEDGRRILFDYETRDLMDYNGKARVLFQVPGTDKQE